MINVAEMYKESSENNRKLLSEYASDFWSDYRSNSTYYDNLFKKMYTSYVYFNQTDNESVEEVQVDFTLSVYEWLMMNDKRYSELYRLMLIDDNEYHIDKNFDVSKTHDNTNNHARTDMYGQQTTVAIDNIGEQQVDSLDKVTGWNSNTENSHRSDSSVSGTRQDISQVTKGAQNNTSRYINTDNGHERSVGVLGGITQSEILNRHVNTWKNFNFYMFIFDEICTQFLLVE